MGWNPRGAAMAGLVMAGLAACAPPPPYEEVRDPFAAPAQAQAPSADTGAAGGPIRRDASSGRMPGPDPSIYDPGAPLSATGSAPAPAPAGGGTAGEGAAAGGLATSPVTVQPVDDAGGGDAGAAETEQAPAGAQADAGSDTVTVETDGGLTERLPNTCRLDEYRSYVGQPGPAANAGVTDRPVRVVAPGDIVTQEYNPQRVNFYTDANGTITRVSCG